MRARHHVRDTCRRFGDTPPGHALRVIEDRLADPALDRGEIRQQGPDGNQDPDVRPRIWARLMFGHPARLPVLIVKSLVVWCLPNLRENELTRFGR
jgi:hypothetical protein